MSATPSFVQILLFVTSLAIAACTHMTISDNSHAFIQSNSNEVHLVGVHESLSMLMHHSEDADDGDPVRSSSISDSASAILKFVPPRIDFKECELSMAHTRRVYIVNTDANRTVQLSSISGRTQHFHSSFFDTRTLPPLSNTSFTVVLVGRQEGHVASKLFIYTSEGVLALYVSAISTPSQYKLQPLHVISNLPVMSHFQTMIHLYNPHHFPIQVAEVYSSGGEFQLELPEGGVEGPRKLWELAACTTRNIIRVRLTAAQPITNHTTFIRIKLNYTSSTPLSFNPPTLMTVLEISTQSDPGLYPCGEHSPVMAFGLGGSLDPPKTLPLRICNSSPKAIKVTGVRAGGALQIEMPAGGVKVPGGGSSGVVVANVTYNWRKGLALGDSQGVLHMTTKAVGGAATQVQVSYSAQPYSGGLRTVCPQGLRFLLGENEPSLQSVILINDFTMAVAVTGISLADNKVFRILNWKPIVIKAGESLSVCKIALNMSNLEVATFLTITTNITELVVPLVSYSGTLKIVFPREGVEPGSLDLGLLSTSTSEVFRLGLFNSNPVPIELKAIRTSLRHVKAQLLGILNGNASLFLVSNFNLTNSTFVGSGKTGVVQLSVETPAMEQTIHDKLIIETDSKKLVIPVTFSVGMGSLELVPKEILFEDCFSGMVCRRDVAVQSTFGKGMRALGISTIPEDSRWTFLPSTAPLILPHSSSYIGELLFQPFRSYPQNSSTLKENWTQLNCSAEQDLALFEEWENRMFNVSGGGPEQWYHVSLVLHTSELFQLRFRAKVLVSWPRLSGTKSINFPLTQANNRSYSTLRLFNQGEHQVAVQLLMSYAYPGYPESVNLLLNALPHSLQPHCKSECESGPPGVFFITPGFESTSETGVLNTTLSPGEIYEVKIGYKPGKPGKSHGLLLIRNNLTVIEVVNLEGKAAHAHFKFGNRKPGATSPLSFDIMANHLNDCLREENGDKKSWPNLTVRRSFTARNVGSLPIYVHNFYISGLECEGYGFSVLNCNSFSLAPNATKKIDIAFTPDFTLAKVTRTLSIGTSLGIEVNYTLATTVPWYFLSKCSSALPRPSWEPLLYYTTVTFIIFIGFCVFACAVFESQRIIRTAVAADEKILPLDLRQVAQGVLKEFEKKNDIAEASEKIKSPIEEEKKKPDESSNKEFSKKKKLGKRNSDVDLNEGSKKKEKTWNLFDNKPKVKAEKNKEEQKVKRKEEEETSSVQTDSSNEAEKQVKVEKKKKSQVKTKEDEAEIEQPKQPKAAIWSRLNKGPTLKKDRVTKAVSQQKEKVSVNPGKRAFKPQEKVLTGVHCWEQRSFSDVVAKNDTMPSYSNIVQQANKGPNDGFTSLQKHQVEPPGFNSSSSMLGPIGSRKPTFNWFNNSDYGLLNSTMDFQNGRYNQEDFMNFMGDSQQEDLLPVDAENRWENQHALMQLLHENYQQPWKASEQTWNELWSNNIEFPTTSTAAEPSWNWINNPAQPPPPPPPQQQQPQPTLNWPSQTANQTPMPVDYSYLAGLMAVDQQEMREGENTVEAGMEFDPFNALASIWSPKLGTNAWDGSENRQ